MKNATLTTTFWLIAMSFWAAPVAIDDAFTLLEDQSFVGDVSLNDYDDEGLDLVFMLLYEPQGAYIFQMATSGQFSFQAYANVTYDYSFQYIVCNGLSSEVCDIGTVTLDIIPQNDPPNPNFISFPSGGAMVCQNTLHTSDVLNWATDVDGDGLVLSEASVSHGTLTFQGNGQITYMPDLDFVGTDTFDFVLCDQSIDQLCSTGFRLFQVRTNVITASDIIIQSATCPGVDDGIVSATLSGGYGVYIFNWSDGGADPNNSGLYRNTVPAGTHTVNITTTSGCGTGSLTVDVPVDNQLTASTQLLSTDCVTMRETVKIIPSGGQEPYSFSIGGESVPDVFTQWYPWTYGIDITDAQGCELVFEFQLLGENCNEEPSFFPEGFSPNDDGINDVYLIGDLEKATFASLKVWDINGKVVYEAQPYLNDWNGRNQNGELLIQGTYYFSFETHEGSAPKIGFITLQY